MITQKTRDRLNDIMALADAHAYAKIMPGTPWEQLPCTQLEKAVQAVLAENEALRAGYDAARLEIASLHAQLEAVGAGGVGPLVGDTPRPNKATAQFLSDVMTAAGLVEHGKQCKALAERLSDGCRTLLTALAVAPMQPQDGVAFELWRADHMPDATSAEARAEWCALHSGQPPADLLQVVDRILCDAYNAGHDGKDFDLLGAKAKVAALFSVAQQHPTSQGLAARKEIEMSENKLRGLLAEALAALDTFADVAPAVSLRADIRAALAAAPAQPVATIYVTESGCREVDDWGVALPVGATTLYKVPQPAAQAQEDAMDSAMEYEPDQPESMPLTKDEIVSMAIEANPWGIDGRLTEVALSAPSTLLRFVALVTAAERRACTAACEKVKQQAKATANSSFVTDAGKDVHNAMAAGAQNCIAAIAERDQHAS